MLRHVTWTYGHDDDVIAMTRLECGLRLPARQARLMPAHLLQVVANTDPRRTSPHDKRPQRPGSAGVAAGKLMPFGTQLFSEVCFREIMRPEKSCDPFDFLQ